MKKKQKEMDNKEKLFVVQKYILAKSAEEAIEKSRNVIPDEVFIDSDWKKENLKGVVGQEKINAIGFQLPE